MATTYLLPLLLGLPSASAGCNPERDAAALQSLYADLAAGDRPITRDPGYPKPPVKKVLLPQDDGSAALDGSPMAVYFSPSTSGSTKWTISIDGGGWCDDEIDCLCRSKGSLGSSTKQPAENWCLCSNVNDTGDGYEHDCNCLRLPYLDGASFSGYRDEPWPVPNSTEKLHFRGIKNFDAAVNFAMAKGMSKASDFVLSGGSAGGLSTFLHADRVAARLRAEAPSCKKIRAAPIVGYFLDHDNFKHTTGLPGGPNSPQWATPGTGATYTTWMKWLLRNIAVSFAEFFIVNNKINITCSLKIQSFMNRYVYTMQNMSFGADGGLTKACQQKFPTEPGLCFMSPHMQEFIETPFFMFNSQYDAWQLGNIFQSDWQTKAEQAGVLQYGKDFMTQLAPVYLPSSGSKSKNGGMITSCICHGCPWSDLVIGGKNAFQHYFDWSMGRTEGGVASMHIDTRLPNGGGALNGTTFQMCRPFPY